MLHIMDFVFILPNGKMIQHSNNLYYGSSKTQIATNNQITSLQNQINTINSNSFVKQTIKSGTVNISWNFRNGAQTHYNISTVPSDGFITFIYLGQPTGTYNNLQSSNNYIALNIGYYVDNNYTNSYLDGSHDNHIIENISTSPSGSITQRWRCMQQIINYNNIVCQGSGINGNDNYGYVYFNNDLKSGIGEILGKNLCLNLYTGNTTRGSISMSVPYTILSIAFT